MNNEERKLTRLQELEANEEFQRLPEDKKVILIAGEKILEMDQFFKNLLSEFAKLPGNITLDPNCVANDVASDINKLVEEKLKSSVVVKKEDILEMIDQRYNEEALSLENKYQYATQQAIKNMDQSFSEALQRVENLSQFQIQAREEIRKNQDKIYILEEELQRQKEKNESLKKIVDESIEKNEKLLDDNLSYNNYEFIGKQFRTFDDLKDFIRDEAKTITENEIEKYLHEKDIFAEFPNEDLKNIFYDKKIGNEEIMKIYQTQINNGSKLDDLEKLIDKQNEEMKLLSEERKSLITKVAYLVRNNKLASSDEIISLLTSVDSNVVDNDGIIKSFIAEQEIKDDLLTNDEIEFLIESKAVELVKDTLNELDNKTDDEISEIVLKELEQKNKKSEALATIKDITLDNEKKLLDLKNINQKIIELQQELRKQIKSNQEIASQYFFDGTKNDTYLFNDDNINSEYIDFTIFDSEDDMSKHNYYNGKLAIPGTKITRINNYRINNDLDSNSYDETQEIIKNEVEKLVKNNSFEQKDQNTNWQESNQKIVDLENLVQQQEAEINRLKNVSFTNREPERTISDFQIHNNFNNTDANKQKQFIDSLEETLSQLKELSTIQAQTVADLEKQSKKLEEIEQKVKQDEIASKFVTRDNLDQIISEKYKNQRADEAYYAELKKVEEERKKIEEALELERIRLISEINSGKEKLNNLNNSEKPKVEVETKVPEAKEEIYLIETPKKKRKQQIFYEVKVHDRPKLTRADLDK